MDGVSGVAGVTGGAMPVRPNPITQTSTQPALADPSAPAAQSPLTAEQQALPESAAAESQMVTSSPSMFVQQSSETLMASEGVNSAITSNELLGAVLLLLMLEYMQSEDKEEKQGILALMATLAQMQQQNNTQQSLFLYSSSSLSIESSQMQSTATGEAASNAYTNAGVDPAQANHPGTGGLDVVA